MMKKIAAVLSAMILVLQVLIFSVGAVEIPTPTKDFFVNDYADIITVDDKETMQREGEKLYKACKAQVVVVTVNDMGGESIEEYTLNLARSWGIGSKDKNDGILLLLSVSERKVRIEVGEGLEGALPDSKTGRILDIYGMPNFESNDFSKGLVAVYKVLINEVRAENGLEYEKNLVNFFDDTSEDDNIILNAGKAFLVLLIAVLMFWGAFKLFKSEDDNYNNRNGGPRYRGSYGGGFSGRSSGGGGGFSGGGGSFGGGGASRGF